jgi:hypothetical protein
MVSTLESAFVVYCTCLPARPVIIVFVSVVLTQCKYSSRLYCSRRMCDMRIVYLLIVIIGIMYQGLVSYVLLESLIRGSAHHHGICVPFIYIIMAYRHVVMSFIDPTAENVADPTYLDWKWTLFTYFPFVIVMYWIIKRARVPRPYLDWIEWLLLYCNTFIVIMIGMITLSYDNQWYITPISLLTQYLSAHWISSNDDYYCYRSCQHYWPHRISTTPPLITVIRSLIRQHTPLIDDLTFIVMAYHVTNDSRRGNHEEPHDPLVLYLDTMMDDIPQRLRDELWINASPIPSSGIIASQADNHIHDLQTLLPLQMGLSTIDIHVRIPVCSTDMVTKSYYGMSMRTFFVFDSTSCQHCEKAHTAFYDYLHDIDCWLSTPFLNDSSFSSSSSSSSRVSMRSLAVKSLLTPPNRCRGWYDRRRLDDRIVYEANLQKNNQLGFWTHYLPNVGSAAPVTMVVALTLAPWPLHGRLISSFQMIRIEPRRKCCTREERRAWANGRMSTNHKHNKNAASRRHQHQQ